MSGGGGGGTSTTTQNIPDELKPLATAYTNKAIGLSQQGYQPYLDQRYADMNGAQLGGLQMTMDRAFGGDQTGVMGNATGALNNILGSDGNPYLDSMVDRAMGSVRSNFNTAAVNSGSYGNSGLAEQYQRNLGDVATQMYGGAYDADQSRKLQAMPIAQQFGNQPYADAEQLMKAGGELQDQTQKYNDYGYQNYLDQQALPYKQLSAMSGVFGSNLGGSSTTTQSGGGK